MYSFISKRLILSPLFSSFVSPYSTRANGVVGNVTWLKKWGRRDIKRRRLVAQYGDLRLRLKLIKKTDILPDNIQARAKKDLASLPLDTNICRVRNRCIMTDRPRGVVTQFKVCRHKFKEYADEGIAPGVKRSTW